MSVVERLQDAKTLDTAITDLDSAKAEIARLKSLVEYQHAAPVFPVVHNKTGLDHEKRRRLKNMKVFVLDNTLREPSVGATFGHTVQDKYDSMKWVKKVGLTDVIVGALGGTAQVDDQHCREMKESGVDISHNWSFSGSDGNFSDENVPIGLTKAKEYGISNVVIELGASDEGAFDWAGKGTAAWVEVFKLHLIWCKTNLGENSRVILNVWDFPTAMLKCPQRVLDIVAGLAKCPKEIRPMGFMFEEPTGEYFPGEVATWAGMLRQTMDKNGWPSTFQTNTCDAHWDTNTHKPVNCKEESMASDGILILHVHKTWGLGDAQNLEALAAGADGMCAAVCEEGAAMGHVSTCVQLANLARLGNKYVTRRYNLKKIADAARACTMLATGKPIHDRQVVYGPRAVEAVFGFGGIGGGVLDVDFDRDGDGDVDETDHFNLAELLGLDEAPLRLHILSTPGQFHDRMGQCFGEEEMIEAVEKENAAHAEKCKEDGSEPVSIGARLHAQVHINLNNNIEAEYTSPIGLAKLFEQVTNYRTPEMDKVIEAETAGIEDWQKSLLAKAETSFTAHVEATASTDGKMSFDDFNREYLERVFTQHNAFPSYFEPATQKLVHNTIKEVFDTNNDGRISWTEWKTWNLWALTCYNGEVQTVDDLHNVIVRHAVMPLLCKRNTN